MLFAGDFCSESSWWNASDSSLLTGRKLLDFSKINYFLHCLCFGKIFPGFTLWVKEVLSCLILLSTLSLTPQPARRTSYFKGQDGRLSQLTSFYRSTRQTSALPSRVRQKAVLLRSIGKLPHQSCVSHKSRFFRLPALNALHTKKPLLLNCLWIFSAAFMAIKEVIDSADCHWFAIERFLNINVGQRLGAIWLKGRHQSVAA